jgi:prepilin-type N-terminal cleavage/methylation domain-containing protein
MSVKKKNLVSSGFTLAELLISLVIVGLLLAAVAVALNASIINYKENEKTYQTINKARQALTRMTSQLRTGRFVDPYAPNNKCNFFADPNENITYEFRPADNKLYLITNSNGNEYVLCDNVMAATFAKTPTADGTDCKSVQIILTVQNGNYQQKLAAAAVVRKVLDH